MALAWSSGTQLMMGVDTGAVQTSLLFSPAVESIGARLRGRGAMRTANVPVSLKDDGEPHFPETGRSNGRPGPV